jgi:hypothetical protein
MTHEYRQAYHRTRLTCYDPLYVLLIVCYQIAQGHYLPQQDMLYVMAAQQVLSQPYTSLGSPLFATVTAAESTAVVTPAAVAAAAAAPAAAVCNTDYVYTQQQPQQQYYSQQQQQFDQFQQLSDSADQVHNLTEKELRVLETHYSAVHLLQLVTTLQQQQQQQVQQQEQHGSTARIVEHTLQLLSMCKQYYKQVSSDNDTVPVMSRLNVVYYIKDRLERCQRMNRDCCDATVLKHWNHRIQYNAGLARSKLDQVLTAIQPYDIKVLA